MAPSKRRRGGSKKASSTSAAAKKRKKSEISTVNVLPQEKEEEEEGTEIETVVEEIEEIPADPVEPPVDCGKASSSTARKLGNKNEISSENVLTQEEEEEEEEEVGKVIERVVEQTLAHPALPVEPPVDLDSDSGATTKRPRGHDAISDSDLDSKDLQQPIFRKEGDDSSAGGDSPVGDVSSGQQQLCEDRTEVEQDDNKEKGESGSEHMEASVFKHMDARGRKVDLTQSFVSDQVFDSRDALIEWCQEVGRKNMSVVVVSKSRNPVLGRPAMLELGCERGGVYQDHKKKTDTSTLKDLTKKRESGTRKCGCPFTLKGVWMAGDKWKVRVHCGAHNHELPETLVGHSDVARLNEEKQILVDWAKSGVRSRRVLSPLKQRSKENMSTMRAIDNASAAIKLTEVEGKSAMHTPLGVNVSTMKTVNNASASIKLMEVEGKSSFLQSSQNWVLMAPSKKRRRGGAKKASAAKKRKRSGNKIEISTENELPQEEEEGKEIETVVVEIEEFPVDPPVVPSIPVEPPVDCGKASSTTKNGEKSGNKNEISTENVLTQEEEDEVGKVIERVVEQTLAPVLSAEPPIVDLDSDSAPNTKLPWRRAPNTKLPWRRAPKSGGDSPVGDVSSGQPQLCEDQTEVEVVDCTVFDSPDALIEWCQEVGRKTMSVVVVSKSRKPVLGRPAVLELGCERGGVDQDHKKKTDTPTLIDLTKKRESRPRKCGCPFALKGVWMEGDKWKVGVHCGAHNHELPETVVGHSDVARLKEDEKEILVDLSKSGVRRRRVPSPLKGRRRENMARMRTIYNASAAIKLTEVEGKSAMHTPFSVNVSTMKTVENASAAIKLTEVEGKSATHTPVSVNVSTMKTVENASAAIKLTEVEGKSAMQQVSESCKQYFESDEEFERFMKEWKNLTQVRTKDEYADAFCDFVLTWTSYSGCIQYLRDNWLRHKEHYVPAWTKFIKHFGNTSINRVGSSHAILKSQLAANNFSICWTTMHKMICDEIVDIKASFEKSLTSVPDEYLLPAFKELRGCVSHKAMEFLLLERSRSEDVGFDVGVCGCVLRLSYGLPCAHEIVQYFRNGTEIPLSEIDSQWKLLSTIPVPEEHNEFDYLPELKSVRERWEKASKSEREIMQKKLEEIACLN
ncbi:hypothetical protein C5167_031466 [Papaver somniferum]|uniref:Protein FAR1-RELATED SEQUENCE n=1 Tax=Papaver somniferum TaxID=3469 RepID=A0A4Y7K793_PAPSO|nr:hypothetical protein C5167_031466 [Papaver somniferum]